MHLVNDAGCDGSEEACFERINIGRHPIGAGHSAQAADAVIGAAIAHHAHGFDGQQHSESLPDFVIEPRLADLVQINRIGFAQNIAALFGNLARNADCKTRPWEGMAAHKLLVQTQFAAQRAHFIFEEFAQRLDQFHIHAFWKPTNIVVRFDRHRRPAGE